LGGSAVLAQIFEERVMSDLLIDLAGLEQLHKELDRIKAVFDSAACDGTHLGSAVGNDALQARVEGFQSSWDDRRRKISESLGVISGTAHRISVTFHELDGKLASVFEAGASR
jgi:hypothetical protein